MLKLAKISKVLKIPTLMLTLFMFQSAFANEFVDFDQKAFEKAQSDGKTIVLDFKASWCGTCKAQEPILKSIVEQDEFSDVAAFNVDYDTEEKMKEKFEIRRQATIVVLKGENEIARSTGDTSKKGLENLIAKGI